jgi:TRAP-type C4-dicarboxylate transport system permease small subunit
VTTFGILDRAVKSLLGLLAITSLGAMSLLTVVDAFGRYILNRPVIGSVEIFELLMVVLIFSSLPLVTLDRSHISVDIFTANLRPGARRIQEALAQVVAFWISGLLAWVTLEKAISVSEYHTITQMLEIPLGPFVWFMGILLCLNALLHAAQGIRIYRRTACPPASPAAHD